MKTCVKVKKNWHRKFQNASVTWQWFRSKEIGCHKNWNWEMLNGVCLLVNSCLKSKDRWDFCITLWLATRNGIITITPSPENHGRYPGHAFTWKAKMNIHSSKMMFCIWQHQLGVSFYEVLKPTEPITDDHYQTQLMRLSRELKDKRPQYSEKHYKVILHHDNTWLYARKCQGILGNIEMGSPSSPVVFFLWLSFFLINGTQPGWPSHSVLWRSTKLYWFMDHFKRWPVL